MRTVGTVDNEYLRTYFHTITPNIMKNYGTIVITYKLVIHADVGHDIMWFFAHTDVHEGGTNRTQRSSP